MNTIRISSSLDPNILLKKCHTYLGVGSNISVNHEPVYVSDHSHGVLDDVELSYNQVNTAYSCSEIT